LTEHLQVEDDGDGAMRREARACWQRAAEAWDRFVEGGLDFYRYELHGPALLAACGRVADLDVLELGCGQGWFCRQLADAGARVTGIDWAAEAIARARAYEQRQPRGVSYHVMDAMGADEHFAAGSFDLVTGCHSLMDMPDPAEALAAAVWMLRPGGRVVFSICHPGTDTPYREWDRDADGNKVGRPLKIDRYYDRRPRTLHWTMERLSMPFDTVQFSWTLEQWSAMIHDAGLVIERLHEPRPSAAAVERRPELEDAWRLPYTLIFELRPRPLEWEQYPDLHAPR